MRGVGGGGGLEQGEAGRHWPNGCQSGRAAIDFISLVVSLCDGRTAAGAFAAIARARPRKVGTPEMVPPSRRWVGASPSGMWAWCCSLGSAHLLWTLPRFPAPPSLRPPRNLTLVFTPG